MATFNTRIQNRIDTWENWVTVNPTPLKGEICIATVPAETGVSTNEPCILIKIGDGEKAFKDLPILSARAADVYEWARAEVKPSYEADEIAGIDAYIASYVNEQMGISVDTDTQYQIVKVDDYNYKLQSKGKTDSEWADVSGSSFVIPKYDDTALAGRVTAVEGDLTTLKGEGDGSIAKMISAAIADLATKGEVEAVQSALNDYKTANDAAVEAAKKAGDDAQDAVDALAEKVGTVTEGKTVVEMISDAQAAAEQKATNLDSAMGTRVKAIEDDYLKASDKTELSNAISAEAERAAGIEGGLETRLKAVEDDYLKAADKTELSDRIGVAEGKVATLIGEDANKSVRSIAAEELAAQLIPGNAKDSLNELQEIAAWIQSHPEDASAMNEAIVALQKKLQGIDEGEGTVKKYVDDAITALKIGDYALAADLTALAGRVATLEGKVTDEKIAKWDGAQAAAEATAAAALSGAKTELEGKITTAQEAADKAQEEVDAVEERVAAIEGDYLKAADKTELEGKITAAQEAAEKAVSDLDAELKPVAKSGNIKDLTQTEGEFIVLNCGSAAKWAGEA